MTTRLIAFYLPQFHPIPENDAWWGAGFTEWTNVARARPLFWGHDQPHIPADLGFYDLRLSEVREAQADMARAHGIAGFCYWHYWFGNGRRLLERPFQEVLAAGRPDFPFCLAWANESWTGKWHGAPDRLLIQQNYPGEQDETAHFHAILPAFLDPRYLRVEGRPLFVVYNPHQLPNAPRFTAHWRELARQAGLPGLYFLGQRKESWNPLEHGFDGSIASATAGIYEALSKKHGALPGLARRIWRRIWRKPVTLAYVAYARCALPPLESAFDHYPSIVPNWDNTPRAGRRGLVLQNSTPKRYADLLGAAIAQVRSRPPDKQIVFIKSWNEWGEGNYLEPDQRWGRAYLEATRQSVFHHAT